MLLDESIVALNDVLAACAKSADLHEWAAEHGAARALRDAAARAARERRDAQQALADDMRSHDVLPRLPDPEATGLQAVLTTLKALLAGAAGDAQRGDALVGALREVEREVCDAVSAALAHRVPESTRDLLGALDERTREQRERLRTLEIAR